MAWRRRKKLESSGGDKSSGPSLSLWWLRGRRPILVRGDYGLGRRRGLADVSRRRRRGLADVGLGMRQGHGVEASFEAGGS